MQIAKKTKKSGYSTANGIFALKNAPLKSAFAYKNSAGSARQNYTLVGGQTHFV